MDPKHSSDFEAVASKERSTSFVREVWQFVRHTGKWWLLPILIVVMLLGALVFMSSTAVAPFIYTLF